MMFKKIVAPLAATLCLALASPASANTLQSARRLLVVSAPSADDPQLKAQQSNLAAWQTAAADRDVSTIQIVGDKVQGATDSARTLRARYGVPADSFTATLVGKDGHVAKRSAQPLTASDLTQTIDAMPMRRAGQR